MMTLASDAQRVQLGARADAYAVALEEFERVETWAEYSVALEALRRRLQDSRFELEQLLRGNDGIADVG